MSAQLCSFAPRPQPGTHVAGQGAWAGVWHAADLDDSAQEVLPTGHAPLDAVLPGGGWPASGLVEVLQAQPGQAVWRLLLPGLARALENQAGPVVLVGAPHPPFVPSLHAQGLPGERLLWVRAERAAARLWATEQALRCAEVAAVLAWLPEARAPELRRLQLAAQQQGRLLFALRGERVRHEATPARLRLQVATDGEQLQIQVLKRRGPPLQAPLTLPAQPPRLAALLQSRKKTAAPPPGLQAVPAAREVVHALDRTAAAA